MKILISYLSTHVRYKIDPIKSVRQIISRDPLAGISTALRGESQDFHRCKKVNHDPLMCGIMPRGPRPSVTTALSNVKPGTTWPMVAVPFRGSTDCS